jgi:hypothetical protein
MLAFNDIIVCVSGSKTIQTQLLPEWTPKISKSLMSGVVMDLQQQGNYIKPCLCTIANEIKLQYYICLPNKTEINYHFACVF